MPKSDINAFTLAITVAAGTVAHLVTDSGWTMVVTGIVLTITLLAFRSGEPRTIFQSLGFAATAGYALSIAVLGGVEIYRTLWTLQWMFALWAGLTVVFLIVDRVSSEGAPSSSVLPAAAVPKHRTTAPAATLFAAAPAVAPARAANEETTTPTATPAPPPPNAVALPPNVGKPATIYLNVVDAGIACLRAVQAEHLGRDFYRIVENVPPDEKWEFTTGQIVRCEKRKLSTGKALVAFEEAPRAS